MALVIKSLDSENSIFKPNVLHFEDMDIIPEFKIPLK